MKKLSKEISDGVYDGIGRVVLDLSKSICYAILIVIIFFISMTIIQNINEKKCIKNGDCPIESGIVAPSCFPLENVECVVYVGNDTYEEQWTNLDACGYVEAEKMWELSVKPSIEKELKRNRSDKYDEYPELKAIETFEIKSFLC